MRFLVVVAISTTLLGACEEPAGSARPAPTPMVRIDLNTATEKQLEALPGIGVRHARSIIASRNARRGRFTSLDELLQIDGIGPKTVEAIRPYVVVE